MVPQEQEFLFLKFPLICLKFYNYKFKIYLQKEIFHLVSLYIKICNEYKIVFVRFDALIGIKEVREVFGDEYHWSREKPWKEPKQSWKYEQEPCSISLKLHFLIIYQHIELKITTKQ